MSNIAMQGGATGTGTVTLLAPSTSTNRTITLPDVTSTMATADSTLAQFNASGSAPVYACRAWVNFNGTGTIAIQGSGNVSSITDSGVGVYGINLTTALQDTAFSFVGAGSSSLDTGATTNLALIESTARTKTSSFIPIVTRAGTGANTDPTSVSVSVFR